MADITEPTETAESAPKKRKSVIGAITEAIPTPDAKPKIDPALRDRAEAVAEQVTGSNVGKEFIGAGILADAATNGIDAFLTGLETASANVGTLTLGDGRVVELATIGTLTGKRKRRFWSLIGDIGSTALIAGDGIVDIAMIAARLAVSEKAADVYGCAYWPAERNREFDEAEARALGEEIDEVLTTPMTAGVLWRFFISSDSSRLRGVIHTYLDPWLATLAPPTRATPPTSASA